MAKQNSAKSFFERARARGSENNKDSIISGTIIVNVGYLPIRWSNGRWKNAVHRVSEPPRWKEQGLQGSKINDILRRDGGGIETIPERYSIAYFSALDPATVVEPLSCCCRDQAPKKPINDGEYVRLLGRGG
jgi:isopenicillin N synthase-like dioxygenase